MTTYDNDIARFCDLLKIREGLHLDGLEITPQQGVMSLKFASASSHCVGCHPGRLHADCGLMRDHAGRLAYQVFTSDVPQACIGECRVLPDTFQCLADAYYHGDSKGDPAPIERPLDKMAQILEYPHYTLGPLIDMNDISGENMLRDDIAKLLARRDNLRTRLSLNKISTCPWPEPLQARGCTRGHKTDGLSLISQLAVSLLETPKHACSQDEQDEGWWSEIIGDHSREEQFSQLMKNVAHDITPVDCQKCVELLRFGESKLERLGSMGSKRQRTKPVSTTSRLEQHAHDRQLRDLERESDRLGRLLRRAAELDVSRCCNDLRTLLLARGQCEEANLHVCIPPSVDGKLAVGTHPCCVSSPNNFRKSQFGCIPWPPPPSGASPENSGVAHRVADFLAICATRDQRRDFQFAPFVFPPTGGELSAALGIVDAGDVNSCEELLLNKVASTLVQFMLTPLFRALGLDKNIHKLEEVLPVNRLVWPALARLCMLFSGFRELGLSDAELLPEIQGVGNWAPHPDLETSDSYYQGMLRESSLFRSPSAYSTQANLNSNGKFKIRIPTPSQIDDSSLHFGSKASPRKFVEMERSHALSQRGGMKLQASLRMAACSEDQMIMSNHRARSACHIMLLSLLSHDPLWNHSDLEVVLLALGKLRFVSEKKQQAESLIAFVDTVEHILCKTQPNTDMLRDSCKLSNSLAHLIFEFIPFHRALSHWEKAMPHATCEDHCELHPTATVFCQTCLLSGHIHCTPHTRVFSEGPLRCFFFCFECSKHVKWAVEEHLTKVDYWGQANRVLSSRGEVQDLPSDVFVAHSACDLPVLISQPVVAWKLNRVSNPDVEVVISAVSTVSQGVIQGERSWINVLNALVNCAASIADQSLLCSGSIGPAVNEMVKRPGTPHLAAKEQSTFPPRAKVVSEVDQTETSGDALPSNGRKQREANLVTGVIEAAAIRSENKYNIAPGVMIQISHTALKSNQDSNADGAAGSQLAIRHLQDYTIKERSGLMSCMLCGGDYDYLNSSLKPSSEVLQNFMNHHEGNCESDVVHEFCGETLCLSRGFVLKKWWQRDTRVQSGTTAMSRNGRLIPVGIDHAGRLYWHFASSVSSLQVQIPQSKLNVSLDQRMLNHDWHCYETLPAIAQVVKYLNAGDNHAGTLNLTLTSIFPEVAAVLPACPWLEEPNVFTVIERALDLNPLLTSLHDTVHFSDDPAKPHHTSASFIFVRSCDMLWYAKTIDVDLREDGRRLYRLRHSKWESGYDRCTSEENILMDTQVCKITQHCLYRFRLMGNEASVLVSPIDLSGLIAFKFTGIPFQIEASSHALVQAGLGMPSEIVQVRTAILLVEAALPTGAKVFWSDASSRIRTRQLEEASTPIQLIELVLMLEDELSTSCLHTHWFAIRSCVPTRTHLLQHPTCSWAAILIGLLDRAIMYYKGAD